MKLDPNKKIYFASDFHLGVPTHGKSLERERLIVRWLDEVQKDAQEIFLVGDVFDFWFEYKTVVPRGHVRLMGKIAELTDKGIPIHWFTGNHDMWIFDYIPDELGVNLIREPITRIFNDKKFFIGHGDGLGPGDNGYKFIKKIFANKLCQWLFARLHPNLGIGLADFWSRRSRAKTGSSEDKYLGNDKEFLYQFCEEELKKEHYDYFIFGHRHLPLDVEIQKSHYINLGDWLQYSSYGVFDGEKMKLEYYI